MKLNEREYHVFISKLIWNMATAARISSLAACKLDELCEGYCDIPKGEESFETDNLDNNQFAKEVLGSLTKDYANYIKDLDQSNLASRLMHRKEIKEHHEALKELQRVWRFYGKQ